RGARRVPRPPPWAGRSSAAQTQDPRVPPTSRPPPLSPALSPAAGERERRPEWVKRPEWERKQRKGKSLGQAEHLAGVLGDHQLLVGRDTPRRDPAAGPRDAPPSGPVRRRVEVDAQPRRPLAHHGADVAAVPPDAGGEDDAVEPAEGAGERG